MADASLVGLAGCTSQKTVPTRGDMMGGDDRCSLGPGRDPEARARKVGWP